MVTQALGSENPWSRHRERTRGQHPVRFHPGVNSDESQEEQFDLRSEGSEPSEGSGGADAHGLAINENDAGPDTREGHQSREAEPSRERSLRTECR